MRVLAMAHAYPPHHNAGAEMTLHVMLRRLVERGHEVHVVLSREQRNTYGNYTFEGVEVHAYGGAGTVFPQFHASDVVIAHLENVPRAAALCSIHSKPMVHLIHNTHDFTKSALRTGPAQLAVFNTDWMKADYEAFWSWQGTGPFPPHVVVHPPVDPAPLSKVKHGQAITLINLNEDKGGQLFWSLALHRELRAKSFLGVQGAYGPQVVPDMYLEGEEWGNVELRPHQAPADMPAVYGSTKILLMPSIYESYGRTAIEAAICGIPTIAHPTPGLLEALGDAGTFVNRGDVDGWVAAIKKLSSPRGYSAASKKALALAKSLDFNADLDRFADAMEGVQRRGFASIAR